MEKLIEFLAPFCMCLVFFIIVYGLILLSRKRCPNCNTLSKFSGMGGTKYTQFYCKKCKETFWKEN